MTRLEQNYDLAVFQLAVYTILTIPAVYVFARSALNKSIHVIGWFHLIGFCSLLLAASGLIIGAGKDSVSPIGLILSAVGISPLLILVESVLREG